MYRVPVIIILIYLSIAVFIRLPEYMMYDSKRILQLYTLTSIGAFYIFLFVKRTIKLNYYIPEHNLKISKLTGVGLIILLIGGIISALLSSNIEHAFLELSFTFLLLTLILILAPTTLKQHHFLGRIILITALIYSSIYVTIFFGNYISSFLNPMIAIWPDKYNFILTINGVDLSGKEVLYFDHKRFFNHTQTWSLPILLGLVTYYQNIKNKPITIALTILVSCWWMLIFASGGRGSIVGITGAFILIIIISKKEAFHLLKNVVVTVTLGAVFYFILFKILTPTGADKIPFLRSTDSGRFGMWDKAIEMWMQSPFFGAGPMHYAKITTEPYFAHPHNFYIQILSEWGLIGLIGFMVLGFIFIKMIHENYFNTERNLSNQLIYLVFTWSILAAFIHAFFSGVMMTPMSQMWLVIMAAWFVGYNRYDNLIPKRSFNYLHLVYLVLLIIVLLLAIDDVFSLTEKYEEYATKYPAETRLNPRFWVQGLFE